MQCIHVRVYTCIVWVWGVVGGRVYWMPAQNTQLEELVFCQSGRNMHRRVCQMVSHHLYVFPLTAMPRALHLLLWRQTDDGQLLLITLLLSLMKVLGVMEFCS